MAGAIFLIPALPLAGATILGIVGRRVSSLAVASVGTGSVVLSLGVILLLSLGNPSHLLMQTLWTWMRVGDFSPSVGFRWDALSLVFCWVVSGVGALIHLYSAEAMAGEKNYARFFAFMNLFVASMLTLVLADNLLLLYLGWEGVGLCSYLLIGFWYAEPVNGRAARKAFVITRVGDTAMAIGLFVLFWKFGTLDIQRILHQASTVDPRVCALAAVLLLGGALGKSAQLPLQTWLPDAMLGPTPVSALIHAATMVTAGVYLIARMHALFAAAPLVQSAVVFIGAVTLLLAAFSALVQRDIKRILAYSTMSQIGYMFLALGVGAWSAAIFHFVTHAFFKALLFLSAGSVITAMEDEHDVFEMGGLRTRMPLVFWTFLIGACSLAALPWVTAGFYSKDLILLETYASPLARRWLWVVGLAGALLTALYSFRMVFLVFFGKEKRKPTGRSPGLAVTIPLVVLAVFSVLGGFFDVPKWVEAILPPSLPMPSSEGPAIATEVASLLGIGLAFLLYRFRPEFQWGAIGRLWFSGWGFDRIYDRAFVIPFYRIAQLTRRDLVDRIYRGISWIIRQSNRLLSATQTGNLRWYASVLVAGAVFFVILTEFL